MKRTNLWFRKLCQTISNTAIIPHGSAFHVYGKLRLITFGCRVLYGRCYTGGSVLGVLQLGDGVISKVYGSKSVLGQHVTVLR